MKNTDDESKLQDKKNSLQENSEPEVTDEKDNIQLKQIEDELSEDEQLEDESSSTQFRLLQNDIIENEHNNVKLQKYFQTGNEFVELSKETTLKLGILTVLYNSLQNKKTASSNLQSNIMLQNILMNLAMSFVKKSNNVSLFVLSKMDDNQSKQYLTELQTNLTDEIIRMMQIIRQDHAINNLSEQNQKIIYNLLDTVQAESIKFIHNEHFLERVNEQKITLNSEMFKTTKNFIDTFQAIMQSNNNDYDSYEDYESYEDEDDIEDYMDYEVGYNIFDEDLNITAISKQTLNRIQSLNGIYAQCLNVYPQKLQNNIDYFDNTKDNFTFDSKISSNQEIQSTKGIIPKNIPNEPYNNNIIIMEKWNYIRFQQICKELHFSCKVRCFPILTIDENKQTKLSFAELNGLCLKYYSFFRKYDKALKKFSNKLSQYKLWCKNFIYTQYKILLDIIDDVKR